jgi:hypothetical protein
MYMTPKIIRQKFSDGSFIEVSVDRIEPDAWRPHGYRYRLTWVQNGECRVLFDNHHGKGDHFHIDDREFDYLFESINQLFIDFFNEIERLGGVI